LITDAEFDALADAMKRSNALTLPIEELCRIASVDIWDTPKQALANGLMVRGVVVKKGEARLYEGPEFEPVGEPDFREFIKAAKRVVNEAGRPVSIGDIVSASGIVSIAPSIEHMTMRKAGLHFIPGLGYWKAEQYIAPDGTLYWREYRSTKINALMEAFRQYGWPLHSSDIEALTNGEVKRDNLVTIKNGAASNVIHSVAHGLYVPIAAAIQVGAPISKNMAAVVMRLHPRERVMRDANMRLYRVLVWLGREKYGDCRETHARLQRGLRYYCTFRLSDKGERQLRRVLGKREQDEF
jgi:hypothetical protein